MTSISDGGTLTGVGEVLKPRKPDLRIIAVEPENSPVISGGQHTPHLIQGIGAGFIPEVLDTDLIDEVLLVSNDEALETARELARLEGIPGGISSGAALACAMRGAQRDDMAGKTVVTVLPSFAERYLSTALFDGFAESGLHPVRPVARQTAMSSRPVPVANRKSACRPSNRRS